MKTLADMGERAAIRRIFKELARGESGVGPGDDCAALDIDEKTFLLVTTDMVSQRTHVPKEMTPYQLGWFLVAINLSDIAAKGGSPLGLVLSFGLPRKTKESYLASLAKGANACATTYGTFIVGGDTKETEEITLCGTALGLVQKDEFMPRVGARPGDVVAVTGTLGKAGAGYLALKNGFSETKMTHALLQPLPRVEEGQMLAEQRCITSSMDLSDGLSSSLYQLREVNHVGFEINQQSLPVASEVLLLKKKRPRVNESDLVLHFGGDYELLVTIPKDRFETTRDVLRQWGSDLIAIGTVTRKDAILLVEGKSTHVLENKGYEHFRAHHF